MEKRIIDIILFDLDGTLVDSAQDIVNAVNQTLSCFDRPVRTASEIISYVGRGARNLICDSLGETDPDAPVVAHALEFFESYYVRHLGEQSRLFPGVRQILDAFAQKPKIIVTNRHQRSTETIVRAMGIAHHFRGVVTGNDSNCVKPSACPILRALQGIDHRLSRVLMVGDMGVDILSGKAAGVVTCAVTYGLGSRDELCAHQPDFVIDEIMQLEDVVQ